MIEAQGLSKAFAKKGSRKEKVQAISGVSFRAENSAITGLLGPNGAGKSTTLRILASLIKPDSGSAQIDGFDVVKHPLEARKNLGFLPHNSGVYPRLTARENVAYYAALCGLDKKAIGPKVSELVELLAMEDFADRRTEGFSQGQRTKVALARALIHDPKTLILDEPTNGLDVMATRKLRTLLRRLKDRGHCVLISSHIMQEVSMLCDHVAIISDGSIAMADSVAGILSNTGQEDLEDAFVVAIGESLEEAI
jgi:sodium transport system ATP-binding protein